MLAVPQRIKISVRTVTNTIRLSVRAQTKNPAVVATCAPLLEVPRFYSVTRKHTGISTTL